MLHSTGLHCISLYMFSVHHEIILLLSERPVVSVYSTCTCILLICFFIFLVETTLDWLTEYSLPLLLPVTSPYACTPPLRGARVDNRGVFMTRGLQSSDGDRYSCTSEDFNGTIILIVKVKSEKTLKNSLDNYACPKIN